jgi:hypothetical protein
VLRHADHPRVDETKRDGPQSGLLFDGKDLAVFHVKENVYATVAKPGTVNLVESLQQQTKGPEAEAAPGLSLPQQKRLD